MLKSNEHYLLNLKRNCCILLKALYVVCSKSEHASFSGEIGPKWCDRIARRSTVRTEGRTDVRRPGYWHDCFLRKLLVRESCSGLSRRAYLEQEPTSQLNWPRLNAQSRFLSQWLVVGQIIELFIISQHLVYSQYIVGKQSVCPVGTTSFSNSQVSSINIFFKKIHRYVLFLDQNDTKIWRYDLCIY